MPALIPMGVGVLPKSIAKPPTPPVAGVLPLAAGSTPE